MSTNDWKNRVALVRSTDVTTVIIDGGRKVLMINNKSAIIKEFYQALEEGRLDDLEEITNRAKVLQKYSGGKILVEGNLVLMEGEPLPASLSSRIIEMMESGHPFQPFISFWENLKANPSESCRNELYKWMESNHFAITYDGCILAYKVVTANPHLGIYLTEEDIDNLLRKQTAPISLSREEYKERLFNRPYVDIHSRSFPQGEGDIIEVPREMVDDNGSNTCSQGLHVCGFSYTQRFGSAFSPDSKDTVLFVSVSPQDWISIPQDDVAKARVCKYTILGINSELTEERRVYVESLLRQQEVDDEGYYSEDDEDEDSYYEDEDEDEDYYDYEEEDEDDEESDETEGENSDVDQPSPIEETPKTHTNEGAEWAKNIIKRIMGW